MPSINYLNPPPHPFWDFVANIEDHPFFAAYGLAPTGHSRNAAESAGNQATEPQPASAQTEEHFAQRQSDNEKGKQPSVDDEDPPEVDPTTLSDNEKTENENAARGGPFATNFGQTIGDEEPRRWGRGGHGFRGGRARHRHRGPPGAFPFGGCFPFGRQGPLGNHGEGAPPPGPWWARPPFPPPPPGAEAPSGPPPPNAEAPEGPPFPPWGGHHRGRHHHRPPPHHHHGRHGRHGSGGFNLGEFLTNLGTKLGIDLTGAAQGLGLEPFNVPRTLNFGDIDFEPRSDLFDTPSHYILHLSLPGAKKEDLGVDWDGENSVLRVAGVVHRPGADEAMLEQLVVDGRKREVGVFEKSVRLGTKRDPARVDVDGITAKMMDGVLVVRVPKVEVRNAKREVPISSASASEKSDSPPPALTTRDKDVDMEKGTLLDREDEDMNESAPAKSLVVNDKEEEAQHERDTRSESMDVDHHHHEGEALPKYEVEEDAEEVGEEGEEEEGEYVKITVD